MSHKKKVPMCELTQNKADDVMSKVGLPVIQRRDSFLEPYFPRILLRSFSTQNSEPDVCC